jgi:acyl-CoA synthetase (AMP-forming)/AMP-acid ligase II
MEIDVTSLTNRRATNRWERTSVGDMFERAAWAFPDKEAIVGWSGTFAEPEFERVTYKQADLMANRLANGLLAAGLKRSDRVMMVCGNSVEAVIFKIAVAKAGLVAVPINPGATAPIVEGMLKKIEPAFLVVDAEFWPEHEAVFTTAGLKPSISIAIGGDSVPGSKSIGEFAKGQPETEPDVEIHGDDIWEILHTSGTTSAPKGAMVSHHAAHYAAFSYSQTMTRGLEFEYNVKVVTFLTVIFHASDQIFSHSVFVTGGTLILGRTLDPIEQAAAITRERGTALWGGSSAMLRDFADKVGANMHNFDLSSLTVIFSGWAAMPAGTYAMLRTICGPQMGLCMVFGQTEAISCHRFWPAKWPETYYRHTPQLNYVGVTNPIQASMIVDENMNDLRGQPGEPGEVVYRSPALVSGYYREEQATREATKGGWFHSGDALIYDEHGLRAMVDRLKDIVKSGGEIVASSRVEAVGAQFPGVVRCAVAGLPHKRWGEAVTAFLEVEPGKTVEIDAFLKFCRQHLAGFETPKGAIVVEKLPVEMAGGKVKKNKLRAEHHDFYLN